MCEVRNRAWRATFLMLFCMGVVYAQAVPRTNPNDKKDEKQERPGDREDKRGN